MSGLIAGDHYGLASCALITVAMQLFFFAIANTFKFDKVTDLAGSVNFVVLALVTYLGASAGNGRMLALTVLVSLARLELALFLLYRVCARGRDVRFDEIRGSCCKFFVFWVFQMVWVWLCSLPVMVVNSVPLGVQPELNAVDFAAIACFALGFVVQVVSDRQKYVFRANPTNKARFMGSGLWSWSRHPNYFGEIVMWWCAFVLAVRAVSGGGSATPEDSAHVPKEELIALASLSPLFTMLILLFGSGALNAEQGANERYGKQSDFLEYRERTSPIIPMPSSVWAALPRVLRRCCCCEFRIYEKGLNLDESTTLQPRERDAGADGSAA